MRKVMKVAIVGAGAAGLCALRHLTCPLASESLQFVAVCFEQASRVGGTWFYTDKIGEDEHGLPVHSSMYQNLKTNLPKECMAFPDFAFPKTLPSFVGHEAVQKYLEDYASHFDVVKHIKFQTIVEWIKPIPDSTSQFQTRWEVTTKSVISHDEETSIFDAVLICNGHYALPLMPDLPGLETFSGYVLHSHNYRRPSNFADKTVVLLGAASSGQDICLEMSTVAKQVLLSHNKSPLTTPLPENVQQKPGIKKVNKNQVEFLDDSISDVDVILLCTGYHYDYHFLAPECGLEIKDGRVTPLYKHFIHTKFPTLGIIGVCKVIVPFPMFDVQARFFRSILDETLILPSEKDMNEDTERDYRKRLEEGLPHRHAHHMGVRQFHYNNELADMAKTSQIPDSCRQLYTITHDLRQKNLMNYKRINFSVNESGDGFRITE